MASLRSICKTARILRRFTTEQKSFTTAAILSAEWHKNWKPGPYPKTPEERAAAAKKYGMRVQDYEPYPDDGSGYGDYPMIKAVGELEKNPWEAWDFPERRRNYGEVMHIDTDVYFEQSVDTSPKKVPNWQGVLFVVCFFSAYLIIMWLVDPYPVYQKALRKQYPYNNLWVQRGLDPAKEPTIKHYTFEPVD